jgi:uncharacterized oxidoreductase
MKLVGNTILITGGGSGLGLGFAREFLARGNKVIIAGRRKEVLDEAVAKNPGMEALQLDISNLDSIKGGVAEVKERFPGLNMLFNNAGVMAEDAPGDETDDDILTTVINTNLLGSLRLSSQLAGQIKSQQNGAIFYMTSVLGFVPFARAACYSATKAGLHAYAISQRHQMKVHGVRVIEVIPPRVEVHQEKPRDPFFMALHDFLDEAMAMIESGADEIVVQRAAPFRANPGPAEHKLINELNDKLANVALD